jgi:phytoene dehydrogenase-like protein
MMHNTDSRKQNGATSASGPTSTFGGPGYQPREADVIVIGAGHNGLTAACYMARAGLSVLVVEASARVGGCTSTGSLISEAPDHKINPCAVDFIWLRGSNIVLDLGLEQFGYQEVEVAPMLAHVSEDGASIALWKDAMRTVEEVRRLSEHDARAYLEFAQTSDAVLDIILPIFLAHPTRPGFAALSAAARGARKAGRGPLAALAHLANASASDVIEDRFRHPTVRNLLAGMAAIAGPVTAKGSALNLLWIGMAHRFGIGRPIGGSQALPDALARCCESYGGQIRTGAVVQEMLTRNGRVTGVRLTTGEEVRGHAVLASCDPRTTLTELVPRGLLSERLLARAARIPTRCGGGAHMKVDLALSGRLDFGRFAEWRGDGVDLRQPSVFWGSLEELRTAFDHANRGQLPPRLPFWAVIPTATDPSQAPEGQDTLYVWLGWMPHKPAGGWDVIRSSVGDAVVGSVATLHESVNQLEIGRWVESPVDMARRVRLPDGSPWHVDFARLHLGPLRPSPGLPRGYRTPADGLYLTGAGTHPAPGVSGIQGKLAAETVVRALAHPGRRARPRVPRVPVGGQPEPTLERATEQAPARERV